MILIQQLCLMYYIDQKKMNNRSLLRKYAHKLILFLFFVLILIPFKTVYAGNLTGASDTLQCPSGSTGITCGGSRLSYRAGASSSLSGQSVVTIQSSGNADNNTKHLFPGDQLCFSSSLLNGCQDQNPPSSYTVSKIVDTTHFNIKNPLTGALSSNDFVIASESAQHLIAFTLTNAVSPGGKIVISIPAVKTSGKTNDGFPDTASSIANSGFDLGGSTAGLAVGSGDVNITGCTSSNWGSATVTAATGGNAHTVSFTRSTSSCAAGTAITVTVGSATHRLVNPAPITSGHSQGGADFYTITVQTQDNSSYVIDSVSIKVAPVESVYVSATVNTSLSFSIAGISLNQTKCGQSTSVTTTATTVPWATISTANSPLYAAQLLSLSTNSTSGYTVKTEENDQMGLNGKVCTGASAGEESNCIKDTTCDGGACTESTSAQWNNSTTNGFGFSLENVTNTDAAFTYNEAGRTFSSRQFADQEAGETKQNVMSASGPKNNSQVNVCYKIDISPGQPAGYYYNIVRYTASAVF